MHIYTCVKALIEKTVTGEYYTKMTDGQPRQLQMWISIPYKVAQCFLYNLLFWFGFMDLRNYSYIVVMLYIIIVNFNVHSSMYFMCETQDQLHVYIYYMYGAIES